VVWKPYFLNPALASSNEPKSKRDWYISKFGEEKVKTMEPYMSKMAAAEGIAITYDGLVSGTLDSHRLNAWAATKGKQNEVVEATMKKYFEQGKSPGDSEALASAAEEAGLDREEALAMLKSNSFTAEVTAEAAEIRDGYGVSGVPFFVVRSAEGRGATRPLGVSGAQDPDTLVRIIRQALDADYKPPAHV